VNPVPGAGTSVQAEPQNAPVVQASLSRSQYLPSHASVQAHVRTCVKKSIQFWRRTRISYQFLADEQRRRLVYWACTCFATQKHVRQSGAKGVLPVLSEQRRRNFTYVELGGIVAQLKGAAACSVVDAWTKIDGCKDLRRQSCGVRRNKNDTYDLMRIRSPLEKSICEFNIFISFFYLSDCFASRYRQHVYLKLSNSDEVYRISIVRFRFL